ncbi:MAG: MgtC/SapB family protein [Bacillota bacterium]|nr:MgtC/SapB family protein [Bacillota bacterium]
MDLYGIMDIAPFSVKEVLLRVGIALFVGGIIGLEREYKNRPAGTRTHVLVCLGACMIALLETLLWNSDYFRVQFGDNITLTIGRLSAQVISGIGFLGAGTIFMAQKKIAGLTTAASLWNVACLGIVIGFGYYWLGLLLGVIITAVLLFLSRFIRINAVKHVEIKYINRTETVPFINQYFESVGIQVLDIDFHIENPRIDQMEDSLYTNVYTLHVPRKLEFLDLVTHLSEFNNIQTVRTRNA